MEAPVPRPLAVLRGDLESLLRDPDLAGHEGAWLQVTLTDDERPLRAMARLRERFTHTLSLAFEPATPPSGSTPVPVRRTGRSDHDITLDFVAELRGRGATTAESTLLRDAVDACCDDPDVDVLVSSGVDR